MRILIAVLAVVATSASAQSTPPGTDIYLAPITIAGSSVTIGTPVNITNRKGYENQPSFTPDGASILYTSVREDGQADIWRYDLRDKSTHQVTHTPESEYSATVMPGGKRFSVVRVEKDSTQRLWSFALDGSDPQLVLTNVKPVGYHAWIDDSTLALFVLGRPNTLQVANTRSGLAREVARSIGRSLQPMPWLHGASFLQERGDSSAMLSYVMPTKSGVGGIAFRFGPMLARSDFLVWLPNRRALAGQDSKLFAVDTQDMQWAAVADLSPQSITHISRLAVSPDGRWLAIVADDAPSR